MTFRARLCELLTARGKTASDLARFLGITPQAVGQWGRKEGTNPTGAKLERIADFLSVTVPELMAPPGAPFGNSATALPVSEPKESRLVDDPDQLALLIFWDELDADEKIRAFRILQAAVLPIEKTG